MSIELAPLIRVEIQKMVIAGTGRGSSFLGQSREMSIQDNY